VLVVLAGCGAVEDDAARDAATRAAATERPRATPVALASATLADGRRIHLRSVRDDAGPCLMVHGVDARRRGCGRPPSARTPAARAPIAAEAIARTSATAPLEVYGTTSPDAVDVRVAYVAEGRRSGRAATLLRVDRAALRRARVDAAPFGLFLAELPTGATRIRAVALDAGGTELGSAGFGALRDLHPRAFIADGR
jgi:hypothetical protein